MKKKNELAQFLSDYCGGTPPKDIYKALCKFEDEKENLAKHNSSSKKDCFIDDITLCDTCNCITKNKCAKCGAIKCSPS